MKANTCLAAVAAALLSFVAGLAQAYTTYNWTGSKAANAPTNAYDWTGANWDRSPYPQDANADVKFANNDNVVYVRAPDDLTLYRITAGSKSTVVMVENDITLRSANYTGTANPGPRVYARKIKGFGGAGHVHLCGDVEPLNNNMTFGNDKMAFRFDQYANSASAGRTNMIANLNALTFGTGSCIFYAPRGAAEQTANWHQVKGSPYLMRVSATSPVLAVGTAVTGDGIPDGTFLRRVYGTWIELSQAVTKSVAENAVTFAAFEPDTYQHVNQLIDNGGAKSGVYFTTYKFRAEDKATVEIDTVETKGTTVGRLFGFESNYTDVYPWHIILHKVVNFYEKDDMVFRYRSDIEFAARTDGGTPGFPQHVVRFADSAATATFTVGEGLNARFLAISNLVGKVTKKGAGRLSTMLGDNTTATTGAITIEEGVFEVLGSTTGAVPALYKVTIKAGATLKLAENTQVSKFTAEPGAIVDGPGSLEVVGADLSAFPQGVKFTGGASFTVRSAGGDVLTARPTNVTAADLGTPAFWVNTDDPEHDMTYEVSGSTTNVIRWNDCRAKSNPSVDWPFAVTNYLTPTLSSLSNGMLPGPYVEMAKADTASNVKTSHGLKWDRTITGIRAVFVVWNAAIQNHQGSAGGYLLGWSTSVNSERGDFARINTELFDSNSSSASDHAAANVLNGERYVNGKAVKNTYVIDSGHDSGGGKQFGSLIESYPVGTGAKANAFGYGGTSGYRSGGQRLYECLVYTNELTYAERMKVREYLSYKWFKTGASAGYTSEKNTLAEVDAEEVGAITVAEGVVDVSKLTAESGSFTKKGAGQLVIEDCVAPDATVSVEGGTLYLQSKPLTLDALPYPENVHVHVDATATNTIAFKTISGKGECVQTWASVRGPSAVSVSAKTANAPLHKIVTAENAGKLKPGMPVVDMGEFYHETTPDVFGKKVKDGTAEYMTFTKSTDLRSVFLVMGSTHGGGQPIGADMGGESFNAGGWLRDTSWALDNPATPMYEAGRMPFCFGKPNTHASIRLNGAAVTSPTTTGFSGDYDLLVGSTFAEAIKSDAFACAHYQNNLGGLELGEAILSTKWHSPAETKHVEAYLMKKWFGQDTVGCREPQIGTLKVAAGATVETLGGGQVTVGAVEGAGTVNAKLAFAGDLASLKVTVVDGAISPLAFGATTTFAGGTVVVDGDASTLSPGIRHTLAEADGIGPGQAWTVQVVNPKKGRTYKAVVENGRLSLQIGNAGFVFFLR